MNNATQTIPIPATMDDVNTNLSEIEIDDLEVANWVASTWTEWENEFDAVYDNY